MTPELLQQIEQVVARAEGWCTLEKAVALAELVLSTRVRIVVEVGVFGGKSLLPMALALRHIGDGVVFGFDPWKHEPCFEGCNDKENDDWWRGLDLEAVMGGCEKLVREFGVWAHASLLRMTSEEGAKWLRHSVDLLHMDGNHSELVSCRDIDLWLPKMRPGGVFALDDTDWPTMQKAVGIMQERCELVGEVGTTKFFKTRKP